MGDGKHWREYVLHLQPFNLYHKGGDSHSDSAYTSEHWLSPSGTPLLSSPPTTNTDKILQINFFSPNFLFMKFYSQSQNLQQISLILLYCMDSNIFYTQPWPSHVRFHLSLAQPAAANQRYGSRDRTQCLEINNPAEGKKRG